VRHDRYPEANIRVEAKPWLDLTLAEVIKILNTGN
jgi:hypothetical protein